MKGQAKGQVKGQAKGQAKGQVEGQVEGQEGRLPSDRKNRPESPLLDIARIICPLATVLHIQLYSAAGLLAAGCWLPAAGCLAINDSDLDWAWWRGFGGKLPGGGGRGRVRSSGSGRLAGSVVLLGAGAHGQLEAGASPRLLHGFVG